MNALGSARRIGESAAVTLRVVAAATLLASLSGCFVALPQQKFDKRAHARIKRIALLQIPEPTQIEVINIGGVAGAFGLIGAMVEQADLRDKSDRLTQMMSILKLATGTRLTRGLVAALIERGYEVVPLPHQRPITRDKGEPYQQDYSRVWSDADAILDVWFFKVGYLSPAGSSDYLPWIRADARLVDAKSKSQYYFQAFSYGAPILAKEIEHFRADGKYAYGNFEKLMANSRQAAAGLNAGADAIARGIAQQLR